MLVLYFVSLVFLGLCFFGGWLFVCYACWFNLGVCGFFLLGCDNTPACWVLVLGICRFWVVTCVIFVLGLEVVVFGVLFGI